MTKKYSNPSQEEEADEARCVQDLYDNPTDENAERYNEANKKVTHHFRDRDVED